MSETSIFLPDGDSFVATAAARGPWSPDATHGGAPTALLVRAVERVGGEDLRVASILFTFFGEVPIGPLRVETAVEKPGRRQQVVRADLVAGERTVLRARAVLLRRGAVGLPAGVDEPVVALGPPEDARPLPAMFVAGDTVGFATTGMEIRAQPPGEWSGPPGARTSDVWFRLRLPIVPGEQPSPVQRTAAAADFGNGITQPLSFDDYLFVNCDLYLSLLRDPVGAWIGIRSRTELDGGGAGVTTTELHDRTGRFGTAVQTLFVDAR